MFIRANKFSISNMESFKFERFFDSNIKKENDVDFSFLLGQKERGKFLSMTNFAQVTFIFTILPTSNTIKKKNAL